MKVGFLTYGMRDRLTGIGRYTVELTRALREADQNLEIVLLNPYPDSGLDWYRSFRQHAVPSLKLVPAVATVGNFVLHRAAVELGLDILHDPCGIAPFLAPRARYRRVTTIHDLVPLLFPRTQPMATRAIFRTLIPLARRTADAVVTVSETSARDLVDHLHFSPERVWVTPNGYRPRPRLAPDEASRHLLELEVREPYFVTVGAISPRKNVERVLAAFELLRERFADATLVVVGPTYWDKTGASRRARQVPGVRFTGFVPDMALQALYERAVALVYVSLYEGFGLPVLEAMAAGAPGIVSRTAALQEVAGDAALAVDPYSTEQVRDAMSRLLTDDGLRQRLVREGVRRASTYTWERTARATLAMYEALLSSETGGGLPRRRHER